MTEAAEASDTSCSPERPPKTTPTRRRRIRVILAARDARPARSSPAGRLLSRDEDRLGDEAQELPRRAGPEAAQEPYRDGYCDVRRGEQNTDRQNDPVALLEQVERPHGYTLGRYRSERQRRHSASRRPSSASSPRSVGR